MASARRPRPGPVHHGALARGVRVAEVTGTARSRRRPPRSFTPRCAGALQVKVELMGHPGVGVGWGGVGGGGVSVSGVSLPDTVSDGPAAIDAIQVLLLR